MATRTFALVALTLAACSTSREITSSSVASDMANSRLVGVWETVIPSPASGVDASIVELCNKYGNWPLARFDADGTYHVDGKLYGNVPASRWRIVCEDSASATIEFETKEGTWSCVRWNIVFETNDRIRAETGETFVRHKENLRDAHGANDARGEAEEMKVVRALGRACHSSPCFSHINLSCATDVLLTYEERWKKLCADAGSAESVNSGDVDALRAERRDAFALVTGSAEADGLLAAIKHDLGF